MSTHTPITEEPARMAEVWLSGRYIPEPVRHYWTGSNWQRRWLEQGQYFATQAQAQAAMDDDSNFGGLR